MDVGCWCLVMVVRFIVIVVVGLFGFGLFVVWWFVLLLFECFVGLFIWFVLFFVVVCLVGWLCVLFIFLYVGGLLHVVGF